MTKQPDRTEPSPKNPTCEISKRTQSVNWPSKHHWQPHASASQYHRRRKGEI